MSLYRHQKHHLRKQPLHKRMVYFVLSLIILIIVVTLISSGFESFLPHKLFTVFQRISPGTLLLYTLLTTARVFIAYFIGLLLTLLIVYFIFRHPKFENFIVPIFDILQSVPVLAFFPLIIVTFARFHMPEIAAQVVLVIAAFWSVLFGALGGLHQIPKDIMDAAKIYNAKGLKLFTHVIFPAMLPSIVTGSIISFGESWNVIIISEYINYGSTRIALPGLGNLLSSSAGVDNGIFLAALICLVLVILLMDRFVWHKLTMYSEKFKFE